MIPAGCVAGGRRGSRAVPSLLLLEAGDVHRNASVRYGVRRGPTAVIRGFPPTLAERASTHPHNSNTQTQSPQNNLCNLLKDRPRGGLYLLDTRVYATNPIYQLLQTQTHTT
uniref:(northern house mosquito) hypothetical protein n=1 Tax=Culex pipiens TaxID=7175 RepID=A0A8D8GAM4_CULPI